jgi:glucose-6-phosphate isomerase
MRRRLGGTRATRCEIQATHLRELLEDAERCRRLQRRAEGIIFDFARQRVDDRTIDLLLELADQADLRRKIDAMRDGQAINQTEGRPVLHHVLRSPEDAPAERASEVQGGGHGRRGA